MTDLPWRPPRPAWAEPPRPPPPPPPPRFTKRQLKRRREKANRAERKAHPEIYEAAREAEIRRTIAAALAALPAGRRAQHREAIERYYRHRGDRWRYDTSEGP